MPNNLEKLFNQLNNLNSEINKVLRQSTYYDYDDLSGLDINYKDADQLFLLNELQGIIGDLAEVKTKIDYLQKSINYEGGLIKTSSGKYKTRNGDAICCGQTIEAFVYDEGDDGFSWVKSRVEHNGQDYYLVGYEKSPLDRLKIRIR